MRHLFSLFILVTSITTQAAAQSGFDEICDIYAGYEYTGESVGEIWFILGESVKERVTDIPALEIYSALNNGDPCSRCEFSQEVAEEQLSRDWQCLEMSSLLNAAKPERCGDGRQGGKRSPYDRLCTIYEEELAGKGSPGPATFQKLANRVDNEIPELEDEFGHLVNFSKEDFYPALKKMADSHTGESWECSFIKRYYDA